MPGAYAGSATTALNNATQRYGALIARDGAAAAVRGNRTILTGLNVHAGKITYKAVADAYGMQDKYVAPLDCF